MTQSEPRRRSRATSNGVRTAYFGILFLGLLVLTCVPFPEQGAWLRGKVFVLDATGILLAMLTLVSERWPRDRWRTALRRPHNLLALAFAGWLVFSSLLTPFPLHGHFELMRHTGGLLLFFAIQFGLPKHGLSRLMGLLAVIVSITCLYAFVEAGNAGVGRVTGGFRDAQLFAAYLGIMLPVLLGAIVGEERTSRRMAFLSALVLGAVGIVAARNRSAWIGVAAGTAATALMVLRRNRSRFQFGWTHGLVLVTGASIVLGVFLMMSNYGPSVLGRARTLTLLGEDISWNWRLERWQAAWQMTMERPLTGWGLGSYPLEMGHYVIGAREARHVLRTGPSMWESAHNSYLQLSAETGLVGLALYVLLPLSAIWMGLVAMPDIRRGLRRYLIMGCSGAMIAQAIIALGTPAWEYPECSAYFWIVLATLVHAAGAGDEARYETPRELPRQEHRRLEPNAEVDRDGT